MTAAEFSAVIAGAGLILSVLMSSIVVSYRVGKIEAELRAASAMGQSATSEALRTISERLARIEGMFELKLKD